MTARLGRDDHLDGPPEPEAPPRPPRPATVELAAAIMIVTGAMSLPATLAIAGEVTDQSGGVDVLIGASLALAVASIVLGVLVRTGRAWLVALNVAAIAGFLELLSLTAPGLLFAALDMFVVVALLVNRPWFQWPPRDDPDADDEAR